MWNTTGFHIILENWYLFLELNLRQPGLIPTPKSALFYREIDDKVPPNSHEITFPLFHREAKLFENARCSGKVKISLSRSLFHSFCLVVLRRLYTTPPRRWKLIKVYLIIMFMSSRSFVIKSFTTFSHSVSSCLPLCFMIEYDEVSNLILCLFCFSLFSLCWITDAM